MGTSSDREPRLRASGGYRRSRGSDQQIAALERSFIREGGYSEGLAAARLAERGRQRQYRTDLTDLTDPTHHRTDPTDDSSDPTDRSDPSDAAPPCPACGKAMVLRTARRGTRSGSQFWGCSGDPRCTGTRPL